VLPAPLVLAVLALSGALLQAATAIKAAIAVVSRTGFIDVSGAQTPVRRQCRGQCGKASGRINEERPGSLKSRGVPLQRTGENAAGPKP
jgi:hypothetical protein